MSVDTVEQTSPQNTTPEAQSRFVVAVNILGVDRVLSEHDHLADARTACTEAWRTGLDARVLVLRTDDESEPDMPRAA